MARNSFGGMAFYGGDQSGITTGRVGRRRLERQHQQHEAPIRHESFDDSMFDFHSQSSMPASQAAAASQEASQQASESAHNSQVDAETGSQMEETRSQQQQDEHGANDYYEGRCDVSNFSIALIQLVFKRIIESLYGFTAGNGTAVE